MGFSTGGGGNRHAPKADINVTPLVDVVLVLLIIFIVAMPVMMREIAVVIPETSDEPVELQDPTPGQLVLEWKEDGRIFLSGVEVKRTELAVKAREGLERQREKVVFFDFHDSVKYADAVSVLDTIKGSGATKLALKRRDVEFPDGAAPAPATP